jgi:hypothetical protein
VGVGAGVPLPLPLPLPVGVPVLVPLGVGTGGVALLLRLVLPLLEALAPSVRDAVALGDTVLLADAVLVGVLAGVGVAEPEDVPVGVSLGVFAAVGLPDQDVLGVADAEAPLLKLPVALPDCVEEAEGVVLGLSEPVPLLESDVLPV